jgi:hypothetical protein
MFFFRRLMGSIKNESKFVKIKLNLEDLFKTDDSAIKFIMASLAIYFLRRKAPKLLPEINQSVTYTDWFFQDGEFSVCVGKEGFTREDIMQAIQDSKGESNE